MKFRKTLYSGTAMLVLAASACSTGGQGPSSVEDKAGKFITDALNGISPAQSQAPFSSKWSGCSEETPGVHRFSFERSINVVGVTKANAQPVIDQVLAYWQKTGYTLRAPEPDSTTREVDLPKDPGWTITVGVDGDQMFVTVSSGCVHVSSDPKTG